MKSFYTLASALFISGGLFAQVSEGSDYDNKLQNWRANDQRGVNVFEAPKNTGSFDGFDVRVGGDFTMQFQALDHSNSGLDTLTPLGQNFNLPTANLNIDAQLAEGMRMHLDVYLSSRHHAEAWVRGGYIWIDDLGFVKDGFADGLMEYVTVKVGMDELNYGDAHFRRTDNGKSIYNPFVGNYIMDQFSTEAMGEVYVRKDGAMLMLGLSNGNLNQTTRISNGQGGETDRKATFYTKLGYDNEATEGFRWRVNGSFMSSPGYDNGQYMYGGDRAGARYYHVMDVEGANANDFSGRYNPSFTKYNAFNVSTFLKYEGVEFFGFFENLDGDKADIDGARDGSYNQFGAELLYRWGSRDQWYVGGRYNGVSGEDNEDAAERQISRLNVGGGYFLTKNVLTKVEYVTQDYSGDAYAGSQFEDGNFNGLVIEAAISF